MDQVSDIAYTIKVSVTDAAQERYRKLCLKDLQEYAWEGTGPSRSMNPRVAPLNNYIKVVLTERERHSAQYENRH